MKRLRTGQTYLLFIKNVIENLLRVTLICFSRCLSNFFSKKEFFCVRTGAYSRDFFSYLLIVLLAMPLPCNQAQAAPSPIVGQLMNEPLSMLDYGLWRTEIELKRYFSNIENIYIAARYNWQKDQIAIDVLINSLPESLLQIKESKRCESVLNSIRDYYGGSKTSNTLFGKSFLHNGYAGTDISQKELFRQLDSMTHIYVSVIKKINMPGSVSKQQQKIDYSNFSTCNSALIIVDSN